MQGGKADRRQAIVRAWAAEATEQICEALVLQVDNHPNGFIIFRSLEHAWHGQVDAALSQAFALTGAELGIAHRLFEGKTPAEIVVGRGTSLNTVRTQLKIILNEVDARSHVNLIHLLGSVRARAAQSQWSETEHWNDPWGNLTYLIGPDGLQVVRTGLARLFQSEFSRRSKKFHMAWGGASWNGLPATT